MTDYAALTAGSIRFASGVSFLVAPEKANRFWGDPEPVAKPTAYLLLHSMGYRDALIGGLLIYSRPDRVATPGPGSSPPAVPTRPTCSAAPGCTTRCRPRGSCVGLGGAVVGIGVGLWGGVLRAPLT